MTVTRNSIGTLLLLHCLWVYGTLRERNMMMMAMMMMVMVLIVVMMMVIMIFRNQV